MSTQRYRHTRAAARRARWAAGAATAAVLLAAGPPAEAAAPIGCGDLVTGEVTLTDDLSCTRTGLVLAPGATLDLGGHTIRSFSEDDSGLGVLGPEHGSATITNGTIRSGGAGILGLGGALVVTHVTSAGGEYGAGISTSSALTVEHSRISGTAYGVSCSQCLIRSSHVASTYRTLTGGATIEDSVMSTSWDGMSGGIHITDSVVYGQDTGIVGDATVVRTRFENVGLGVEATGGSTIIGSTFIGGSGVKVSRGVEVHLVGNLFVDSSSYGVLAEEGSQVTLRHNVAIGSEMGDIEASQVHQDGWNVGVGTVAPPVAPPPGPEPELCGTTLTAPTTLRADLHCHSGITLADGVTLDLAGHTLQGSGDRVGVLLQGAATVRGGTISGWDVGLWSPATSTAEGDRVVVDTTFADNGVGVVAQSGTVRTERVTWRRNTVGLRCDGTCSTRAGVLTDHVAAAIDVTGEVDVRGTTLRSGGTGVLLTSATRPSTLTGSTFFDNTVGIEAEHSALTATRAALRRNGTAVVVSDGPEWVRTPTATPPTVELRSLVADSNDDGILSTGTDVRIGDTVASRNGGFGIQAPGAVDLGRNVAFGNGRSPQLVLGP